MSDRSYQLDFTIKFNIKHVYLIDCNLIFGGKFRFFMSDVEWRRYEGKSFSLKKQSLFLESLINTLASKFIVMKSNCQLDLMANRWRLPK